MRPGGIPALAPQIDVLVNNAGIERVGAIQELPPEAFRCAMKTNYFDAIRGIQTVLPEMREGAVGPASIILGRRFPCPFNSI
jgi:NAD(P)-dependent dehydrogenase (short-subunit alcohol dehydrogenase family)